MKGNNENNSNDLSKQLKKYRAWERAKQQIAHKRIDMIEPKYVYKEKAFFFRFHPIEIKINDATKLREYCLNVLMHFRFTCEIADVSFVEELAKISEEFNRDYPKFRETLGNRISRMKRGRIDGFLKYWGE
ncbi:MAG: hypothetical protein ACTSRH_04400 [Promethearchaeota archaeon]